MSCTVVSSSGLGEYIYGFPCPYDSVVDPGSALQPLMQAAGLPAGLGQYLPAALSFYPQDLKAKGLGCCNCDQGLGYFDSGTDISGWGFAEWGTVIFVVYALVSLASDTKRGVGSVLKGRRKSRSTAQKKAQAEAKYKRAMADL